MNSLRYPYTHVIEKQQPPSLWIHTGSDWNSSRVTYVNSEIDTCLFGAVMV